MSDTKPVALAVGLNSFLVKAGNDAPVGGAQAKALLCAPPAPAVLLCNRLMSEPPLGFKLKNPVLDLLELFAFVCPAAKCTPTIREICRFLGLPVPVNLYEQADALFAATQTLLRRLRDAPETDRPQIIALATAMMRTGGWIWGGDILAAMGIDPSQARMVGLSGFAVWDKLTEWGETHPPEPAGTQPVTQNEATQKLEALLERGARGAGNTRKLSVEERPQQTTYAKIAATAFAQRTRENTPVSLMAQAGTGVGKTLGYLAPVSVWCEKNAGSVWISTFTRNLQRQLDSELSRVFDDPVEKRRLTVIRKGRENYLCLLNFAEAVGRIPTRPSSAVPLGLIARWIAHTADGDVNGGDFPTWLATLLGERSVAEMADRRGECIFAQCPHFKKCFIEKIARRTRQAKIVIANHAFVMTQLAGSTDETTLPARYVFDEAHQIFSAADGIFAAIISAMSGVEMRRWILGNTEANSRIKGLKRRLEDLMLLSPDIAAAAEGVLRAAAFLPAAGVLNRIKNNHPDNVFEEFLIAVRQQVYAANDSREKLHSLECDPRPCLPQTLETAMKLGEKVAFLETATTALTAALTEYAEKEAENIEAYEKQRLDNTVRSLEKSVSEPLAVWRVMLRQITGKTPDDFVDWFEVGRNEGVEVDIGYYRHWIDPTFPFAQMLAAPAHGVMMTSATLTDNSGDDARDWDNAAKRTGIIHLNAHGYTHEKIASPFNYAENARVFILTDVNKNDLHQVAAATRALFIAAQGGALGIFTAISRLKAVYHEIKEPLNKEGYLLLAQHVDQTDLSTLLDIFKSEEESCLLGTDAVRDGIDVPGKSLHLLMFDRMPWERPTIAHKMRRAWYEKDGGDYNLMLVRMKLAQAFGRLIRTKNDKGVFVMLDKAVPSETLTAFPEGVCIEKTGLKDAVARIREFL